MACNSSATRQRISTTGSVRIAVSSCRIGFVLLILPPSEKFDAACRRGLDGCRIDFHLADSVHEYLSRLTGYRPVLHAPAAFVAQALAGDGDAFGQQKPL